MPTNYLYLVSLAQKVGKFAFLASSFFGIILIFLTLFGIRKIFGTYKYLMVIFTSLGVGLACLEAVFHPNLHLYNNGFVFFSLSYPHGFSKEALEMILPVCAFVYSVTISLLAIQFIYRYCTLFSLSYLTLFRGWKSLIWVAYCFFFGALWWLGDVFLLKTDDTTEKYFHEEMLIRYSVTSKEIPMMTLLAYDPNDGSIRWISVIYSFLSSGVLGFQYVAMMYCGWNMHAKMEKKIASLSAALKRHHRQLFRTLVFQITTPTIFMFSPVILIVYLPYFQLELSFPAGATVCAFNFYPAMESIIVMIIVTEYRVVARKMLNVLLQKSMGLFRGKNSGTSQTTGQIQVATIRAVS